MIEETTEIPAFEVLLLEEFAQRLKVGRSTIFDWKKDGTLKPGRHYFQNGRVVRFIWARDVILEINNITAKAPKNKSEKKSAAEPDEQKPSTEKRKVGINLDY